MGKIFIAVATCRRNELLKIALLSLNQEIPMGVSRLEVCVGDNDLSGGGGETVLSLKSKVGYELTYVHCPEPGIPQVRNVLINQALASESTVLIFIDDDEVVDSTWLKELWGYYLKNQHIINAVHGPVLPVFAKKPSSWLPVELYGRDLMSATGKKLNLAATNNVLIDLEFLREKRLFFNERMALTGGEDTEFFFRFTKAGGIIHWCNEAKVYEHIPDVRMTIGWLGRRSFRSGSSDVLFWRLNHSILYTLFWGLRRTIWNFIKNFSYLFVMGKPKYYYAKHLILLMKTFGLLSGILGYHYLEYRERHLK